MKIGRILSPVHSLGPGERVCLWTKGCKKKCPGCISPELQEFDGEEVDEELIAQAVMQVAKNNKCTGLTISGGDPFEQPDALLRLLKTVRSSFGDILVFTGYELEEIINGISGNEGKECLNYIDVLVDGRYIKELNDSRCVLRGSENQVIHFLNSNLKRIYEKYMKKGRILETFTHDNTTIVTGILNEVEE